MSCAKTSLGGFGAPYILSSELCEGLPNGFFGKLQLILGKLILGSFFPIPNGAKIKAVSTAPVIIFSLCLLGSVTSPNLPSNNLVDNVSFISGATCS